MDCKFCKKYLYDFLEAGIHKDLPLSKHIRLKYLPLRDVSDWMYRMYKEILPYQFDEALLTASRIARRERPLLDYEFLIQTATFNFLKYKLSWLTTELEYLKIILIEKGFIKSSVKNGSMSFAQDYIAYTLPRVIITLRDLHNDHEKPYLLIETKEDADDLYT